MTQIPPDALAALASAREAADLRQRAVHAEGDAKSWERQCAQARDERDRLKAQVARLTEALEKTVVSKNWLDAVTIAGTALRGTP